MEENEATMQRFEKQEEEVQTAKAALDQAEFAVGFLQNQVLLKNLEHVASLISLFKHAI